MKKKVIIVGGGASGLVCAIRLKQVAPDIKITILEKSDRVGKKILKTGNGRCNLSNYDMRPDYYNRPGFLRQCLERRDVNDIITFFSGIGLLTKSNHASRVYPYSETAASVLDILRRRLDFYNIEVICDAMVTGIIKKDKFTVTFNNAEMEADYVVLACGSKAQAETNGYELAANLGHEIIPTRPGLVPLRTTESLKSLRGLRVKCRASVANEGKLVYREEGEILFKDQGISGILTLNLSRHAVPGSEIIIDFLSNADRDAVVKIIENRPKPDVLLGILPKMVALEVGRKIDKFTVENILTALGNYKLTVAGTYGFGLAQITLGGVDVDEINADFSSKLVPGLYIIGELLDIDGACGGYNLHFAWTSGLIAAESLGFEKK
ncbi:MAG: aminoacetone oxidase family FAD-binding enzyme [Bacilli bacterium]